MMINGKYYSDSEVEAYIHKLEDELKQRERKPAQWESVYYDPDYYMYVGTCTACGKKHESGDNILKLDYCPHCGARTKGEKMPAPMT